MIKATIIQDSISNFGKRITTFELEYPRFIHSEFMTHRQFSRNAASSRAIPVERMHDYISHNPAKPVSWGRNQAGMQASEQFPEGLTEKLENLWDSAKSSAISFANIMKEMGVHKQITNRLTEPFQTMKTVCTATEYNNWFWLRYHKDAQPEIQELARLMRYEMDATKPMLIYPGEWHVPYVNRFRLPGSGGLIYSDQDGNSLSQDDAKMISASCSAQVSYRKSDDTIEKAKMVFDRLINAEPIHASPIEHQATPMVTPNVSGNNLWFQVPGITHCKANGVLASGNFEGWIQYRQLFSNQAK